MRRALIKGCLASLLAGPALAQSSTQTRQKAAPAAAAGKRVELGLATPLQDLLGNSPSDMQQQIADYARLGATWLRTDFWWDHIQPYRRPIYDFDKFEAIVTAAKRHGLEVLAELHGMPSFVADSGGMGFEGNRSAYIDYALATARRFRGRIRYWEIWNEPNLQDVWGSPPDAALYTRVMRDTYTALKREFPDCFIVSGGLSPAPETARDHTGAIDFVKGMYANGGKGHFDALGFHPYSWPLTPRDAVPWNGWDIMERNIRQIMVEQGDGEKKIWLTEFGAPTDGGKNAVSPETQAEILRQAIDRVGREPWAGPIFWYSYRDKGGSRTDTENWFGLVGPRGERKPAYDLFRATGAAARQETPPRRQR
ncbi:MAG: hypothetical protein AAGC69_03630 [Paracraurococcus sp.]